MRIVLTEFARGRLFRANRRNTIQDITPEQFERHLNEHPPLAVLDGYAPFCKLHVHRNWTSTRCSVLPLTDQNRHLLRSAYEARSREELPVLQRLHEQYASRRLSPRGGVLAHARQLARLNTLRGARLRLPGAIVIVAWWLLSHRGYADACPMPPPPFAFSRRLPWRSPTRASPASTTP